MNEAQVFERILNRECAHFNTYSKLYAVETNPQKRAMLKKLLVIEKRHISMWCQMSGKSFSVNKSGLFISSFLMAVHKLFGDKITYKLVPLYENFGLSDLFKAITIAPQEKMDLLVRIILDEIYNERSIANGGSEISFISHIRDVIFGMNDGLVEILGTAAGLVGIYKSNYITAIAGIIVGISGTLSMAVGAYLSSKSEKDVYSTEANRIKLEMTSIMGRAEKDLGLKHSNGLKKTSDILKKLKKSGNPLHKLLSKAMSMEDSAIYRAGRSNATPFKDALYVGVFYFMGAIIPLLSFIFGVLFNGSPTVDLIIAITLTAIVSAATTAIIALGTHKSVINNVAEYVILSLSTAGITYFIGTLISTYLNVTI